MSVAPSPLLPDFDQGIIAAAEKIASAQTQQMRRLYAPSTRAALFGEK